MFSGVKKLIYMALAATLVFASLTAGAPSASAAAAKTGTVNTADTNLREKPSTASAIVAKIAQGETVSVLATESGGWYEVKYQDFTGYVRTDFVDVLITGLNDSAVMLYNAVMTKEPDPSSEAVVTLAPETQVTVTGSYGDRYQIKAGAQTGFVPKASVHKHRIASINLKATVNSSNVNLRSIPSTSGDVVAVMKKDAVVTAISIQDRWIKVSYSGETGYIRGDFITYYVPPNSQITTMSFGMKAQAVKLVQIALKKKGFYYPEADGVYGGATRTAVAKFQESVSLDADGTAGPQTLLVLLGSEGAASLWNNFRSLMPAQKSQKNGRVLLVDWFDSDITKGMQSIMHKGVSFEVIDVRTGIHWNMERFGDVTAHWHADVCPMTKADTAAMTKAWGGELNSSRRPVWVKYDGKYYAASLMGFVHNTDPISDNGMDGQVCLHFRGSKIHSSGHIDEAQQACIAEAFAKADKLEAYISTGKV